MCDAFPRSHRCLLEEKYTASRFTRDVIAGDLTVGIIAIRWRWRWQLAWRCATYGLYTSAVAGIVIALTGGSRFFPALPPFVVILYRYRNSLVWRAYWSPR